MDAIAAAVATAWAMEFPVALLGLLGAGEDAAAVAVLFVGAGVADGGGLGFRGIGS